MTRYSARVDGRQVTLGTSRHSSRWERPKGELTWLKGSALVLAIALVGLAATVMIGG